MKNRQQQQSVPLPTEPEKTRTPQDPLSPDDYVKSFVEANLTLEEVILKICEMKWEEELK